MAVEQNKILVAASAGSQPGRHITSAITGRTLLILVAVAVILHIGQEIFVPLALALLLTFTLSPIVTFLKRRHVPRVAAVISAVVAAFVAIAMFSFVVAGQVANLAENIPTYQRNIVVKIQALSQAGSGNGVLQHLSKVVERVGAELQDRASESQTAGPSRREPMPVEIVTRSNPVETLGNFIIPLISPFATASLVIVLVVFMLLEREDLRDRFIRLVGLGDLHKTTAALKDAGSRVGKYLLMQLVVNALYAVPIAIGLWWLGIPNAILWGLLTLVLRFVPYIGPVIGMILPLFLALAIAPGWSLLAWVAGLFIVIELISNNVVEPWLYGSHTGLSPLAIIVSAIFWSWLWGPLGLMLSTPLTVCLVVLGRYVPEFSFLDVLLGNNPVLEPQEKLYQRLLAGDPSEATDNAEEFLEEEYLIDYYDKVGLPALSLGEADRQRGVMTDEQLALFAATTMTLVGNLADIALEEESDDPQDDEIPENSLPDGAGKTLLCVGGRGPIDAAAAAMISQVLAVQGATVLADDLATPAVNRLKLPNVGDADTAIIVFLNPKSKPHARQIIRRLKRQKPSLRVGIVMPLLEAGEIAAIDPREISADFICSTISEAVQGALSDVVAVELKSPIRKLIRPRHGTTAAA